MAVGDLENGVPIGFEIWITLGNLAEVLVATLGIRWLLKGGTDLSTFKALAKYLVFATLLVPFVSALVGAIGSAPGGYLLQWRIWFFADALAFLTVAPAILTWTREGREWSRKPQNYLEFAALMSALIFFGYLTFMGTGAGERPALLYSLVPLLLWAALRMGLKGVSTSMLVIALLAIWGASNGRGPFAGQGPLNNALSLQLFLFFAAIPFTVLAVLVEDQKRAREVLREGEQRFRLVANTAPVMIWMTDPDKKCTFLNQTWLDFTGRSPEVEYASGWAFGVHPEDIQRSLDAYNEAFDRRQPFRIENRVQRHDGEYRWVLDVGVPRFNLDGSFAGYIGSAVDVTERKQAEEALRVSEQRFRMAAQAGKMFTYEWDAVTDKIVRSEGVVQVLGIEEGEETTGQHIMASIPPEDREMLIAAVAKLSPEKPSLKINYRMVRSDGTVIWVERNSLAYFDEKGRMLRIIGMVADITDRKLAEEGLRQKEIELSEAQRLAQIGSWDWDPDTDTVTWSRELYRISRRDPTLPALSYKEHSLLYSPESMERLRHCVDEALRNGTPYELDMEMVHPDGSKQWIRARGEAVRDAVGRVVRLRGTVQDINERKLVEKELTLAHDRLRLAMEAAKSVGWDRDVKTGRITLFGDLEGRFGIPSEVFEGRVEDFNTFLHPSDRERVLDAVQRTIESKETYAAEFRILRPDRTICWVAARGKFYYSPEGEPERMLGMSVDITERKLAEVALRESEERLRLAVQAGKMYAFDWDVVNDSIIRSAEANHIIGSTPGPTSSTILQLIASVHLEDRAKLVNSIAELTPERPNTQISYRFLRTDGSVLWLERTGHAFFDEQGKMVRMMGMVADVTERKLAEEELSIANDRLRLAMESGKSVGWEGDLRTGQITWLGDIQTVFGMPVEKFVGREEDFYRRVHPEDLVRIRELLKDAMQTRAPYACEFRTLWPDGNIRWVAAKGKFHYSSAGEPVRKYGITVDITERKLMEESLRVSEERMRLAAQAGRMFAYDWDVASDVIIRSAEATEILGLTGKSCGITHRQVLESIHPADRAKLINSIAALTPEKPKIQIAARYIRPDGSVLWLERTGHGIFDEQGRMVRMIGMVADITARKLAEESLRESEERLRLAAQTGKMYAYDWDVATDAVIRSEQSARIFDLIGGPSSVTHQQMLASVHPDDREAFINSTAGLTTENPDTQISYRVLRSDGSVLWLERTGHAIFDGEGRMVRVIGMVADITERKLAEEALSKVGGRLIEAHEEERTWIARELHDDIGQQLALLANNLELMERNIPESAAEIRSRLDEQLKRVNEISADVQGISHRLHSSKLRYLGIVAAARSFCLELSQQQKVEINFTDVDIPTAMPEEISLCLFRIMQEALQNAVKHSGVRRFDVELRGAPEGIHLTVRDAGLGFDTEAIASTRGLGLISMQERVNLVKGTLSIESAPNLGTTIHVRVPLSPRGESARAAGDRPLSLGMNG
jgi:PAS domain S-box-containing protein